MSTASYWCEWAWLGADQPAASVLLTIDGDRIVSVQPSVEPSPDAVQLDGLTLPGFANTHSHAFHRALRGRTHAGEGSFWTWRDEMYRVAGALTPDSYHELAFQTFSEMLQAGYTVVGEFHYLHHGPDGIPYDDANAMSEAVVDAAIRAGIRITLLDTLYLHGGIGLDGDYLATNPVQRRFSDGSADAWAERLEGFRADDQDPVKIGAAIHSVRAVDPTSMEIVGEWVGRNNAPLHAHVSEQPAENDQCCSAHGVTPTALLDHLGLLNDRFTAVHATHLTDADILRLVESSTTACLCPTTERDLADGIGPSKPLAEAGASLAIGSDSQAVIDPFEETRAVELNQRLATLRRGNHTVTELLDAGTVAGYRALGWPDGGTIRTGSLADLVTLRVDETEPTHVLAAAIYSGHAADISHVMVGGKPVQGSHEI